MKTPPYKFVLFASVFFLADFILENVNHKFSLNDFKVYYGAAGAITTSSQLYNIAFSLGSGYYKYSPFIALLFYPLSLLSYPVACIVYFIIVSCITVFTFNLILAILQTHFSVYEVKTPALVLSIAFVCLITHIVREVDLGNINMILLCLLSLCIYYLGKAKMLHAGILLGLVIITKPFFVLLFIPLLIYRSYKTAFTAAITLLLASVTPVPFLGFNHTVDLNRQWFNAMLNHSDSFPSPNTIEAISRYYAGVPELKILQYLIILVLIAAYITLSILNYRRQLTPEARKSSLVFEWFLIIAIIPSILKTDTEHFLFTLPLIMFLIIFLFQKRNIIYSSFFTLSIILYAGNISDLIGMDLSHKMYNAGLLGIANLLLLIFACLVYYKKYQNNLKSLTDGIVP